MADSFATGVDPPRSDHLDRLFETLADEQRRQVIRYFLGADEDVTSAETLLTHLRKSLSSAPDREQLEIELFHATLPKLADLGIVEYGSRPRRVRYCGCPLVEGLLATATDDESLPREL